MLEHEISSQQQLCVCVWRTALFKVVGNGGKKNPTHPLSCCHWILLLHLLLLLLFFSEQLRQHHPGNVRIHVRFGSELPDCANNNAILMLPQKLVLHRGFCTSWVSVYLLHVYKVAASAILIWVSHPNLTLTHFDRCHPPRNPTPSFSYLPTHIFPILDLWKFPTTDSHVLSVNMTPYRISAPLTNPTRDSYCSITLLHLNRRSFSRKWASSASLNWK